MRRLDLSDGLLVAGGVFVIAGAFLLAVWMGLVVGGLALMSGAFVVDWRKHRANT